MRAKQEYRDRDGTEVAVLDALADRQDEGMTIFELRAAVEADIDTLEDALERLDDDDLIEASRESGRTVLVPNGDVVTESHENGHDEDGFIEDIRRRLPF
jgi:hypothetical protein